MYTLGVFSVFMMDYYETSFGMSKLEATGIVSVMGIGILVGTFAGGLFGQKIYNYKKTYLPVFVMSSIVAGTIPSWFLLSVGKGNFGSYFPLLSFFAGFMAGLPASNINGIAAGVNRTEDRSAVFALLNVLENLGKGGGPLIVSLLLSFFPDRKTAFILSILFWIPAGLLWIPVIFNFERDELNAGISSGGMNAALIAAGFPLGEIKEFYFRKSSSVFRAKLAFWESFYDSKVLKRTLDEILPSRRYKFKDTVCELLILSRNLENSILYGFSTLKNQDMPLSSAVMRTTALPVIFGPWEDVWMDGGVGSLVNPAEAGIRYAVSLGANPSDISAVYLDSGLDPNRVFRKEDKSLLSHLSWSLNALARDHIFSSTGRIKYHFPGIQYYPYFFTFSRFHVFLISWKQEI